MAGIDYLDRDGSPERYLVCADGQPAYMTVDATCGLRSFFGQDGQQITPTSWVPGPCPTAKDFETICLSPDGGDTQRAGFARFDTGSGTITLYESDGTTVVTDGSVVVRCQSEDAIEPSQIYFVHRCDEDEGDGSGEIVTFVEAFSIISDGNGGVTSTSLGTFTDESLTTPYTPANIVNCSQPDESAVIWHERECVDLNGDGLTHTYANVYESRDRITLVRLNQRIEHEITGALLPNAVVTSPCDCAFLDCDNNPPTNPLARDDFLTDTSLTPPAVDVSANDVACQGQVTTYVLIPSSFVNVTVTPTVSSSGIFTVAPIAGGPYEFMYEIYCDGAPSGSLATVTGEAFDVPPLPGPVAFDDVAPISTSAPTPLDVGGNDMPCLPPAVTTYELIAGSEVNCTVDPTISTDGIFEVTATAPPPPVGAPVPPPAPAPGTATYETISAGNWSDSSTWAGGTVPVFPILSGETVVVHHDLTIAETIHVDDGGVWIDANLVIEASGGAHLDASPMGTFVLGDGATLNSRDEWKIHGGYSYFGPGSNVLIEGDYVTKENKTPGTNTAVSIILSACMTVTNDFESDGLAEFIGSTFVSVGGEVEIVTDGATFAGTRWLVGGTFELKDVASASGSMSYIDANKIKSSGSGSIDLPLYCGNLSGSLWTGAQVDDCAATTAAIQSIDCSATGYSFDYRILCDGVDSGETANVSGPITADGPPPPQPPPPPGPNSTWTQQGGHFGAGEEALLFDNDLNSGERLHQNGWIRGDFAVAYSPTDTLNVYWSDEQQPLSPAPNQIMSLIVEFSADGGATWPVNFTTPFNDPPIGNQWFDVTPGIAFNAVRINCGPDTVGPDPWVREIRINGIPN